MIRYCGVLLLSGLLSAASTLVLAGQGWHAAANAQRAETLMAAADPAMAEKLIARGDELFRLGDVASARLLYERAAHEGSLVAETAVGRTFDPFYFEASGLVAAAADPVQAMRWYRTAAAKGDADADRRLKALAAWLQLDTVETVTDATIAARYAVIMEARRVAAADRRQRAEKSRRLTEKSEKTAAAEQAVAETPAAPVVEDTEEQIAAQPAAEAPATSAVEEAEAQIAAQLAAEDAARQAASERAAAEKAAAERAAAELAAAEQAEERIAAERAAAERAVAAERAAERRARLETEEAAALGSTQAATGQIADAEPTAGGSGVPSSSAPRSDDAAPPGEVPADAIGSVSDETAPRDIDAGSADEEGDSVAALIDRQRASVTERPGVRSANRPSAAPWQTTDDGVRYRIEDGPNGFFVSVYHAPLNIIPDTVEVEIECREAVSEMARRLATDYGRLIRPIQDERIRTTTWRNAIDIRTRCIGTTLVEFRN